MLFFSSSTLKKLKETGIIKACRTGNILSGYGLNSNVKIEEEVLFIDWKYFDRTTEKRNREYIFHTGVG